MYNTYHWPDWLWIRTFARTRCTGSPSPWRAAACSRSWPTNGSEFQDGQDSLGSFTLVQTLQWTVAFPQRDRNFFYLCVDTVYWGKRRLRFESSSSCAMDPRSIVMRPHWRFKPSPCGTNRWTPSKWPHLPDMLTLKSWLRRENKARKSFLSYKANQSKFHDTNLLCPSGTEAAERLGTGKGIKIKPHVWGWYKSQNLGVHFGD